jgi:hypothetical protein
MTERAAPTQPPLVLCEGRLIIYPDGEFQTFMRDNKSWTTGVLNNRDVGKLVAFLPTLADNTLGLFDVEVR